MYITLPASLARSYKGQNRSSESAMPFALPNSMTPLKPSSPVTRSNSVTDAPASLSGNVASALNRSPRSRTMAASASLARRANSTDRAGLSIKVPGAVNVITCMSIPAASSTRSRYAMSRCPGTM